MELKLLPSKLGSFPTQTWSYAGHIKLAQTHFLHLSSSSRCALVKDCTAEQLQKHASALESQTLMALATQMKANSLAKDVDLIEELIAKLKEEAAAKADHKQWCEHQLMQNNNKRNKNATESEKLMAETAEMNANIDSVAKTIQTLILEHRIPPRPWAATAQRTAEKIEKEATLAKAQASAGAVKSALVVLRNFCKSGASSANSCIDQRRCGF